MKKKYYLILVILIILIAGGIFFNAYFFTTENDNIETIAKKTKNREKDQIIKNKKQREKVVGKSINQEYKSFQINNELAIPYYINYDSNEDLDLDNLTNQMEKKYATNPELSDTDLDGLDDYIEIFKYKTNPLKKDSDNDGISDYDEIYFNLNPLLSDSYNDGILDGKRILLFQDNINGIDVTIKGTGDIASSNIIIDDDSYLSKYKGFLPRIYTIVKKGTIDNFQISVPYSLNDLLIRGITEEDLTIYGYDEENESYQEIETIIDKDKKLLYANLKDYITYLVGDKKKVNKNNDTEIFFLVDNTWSMYSNLQYKNITGKNYNTNGQNKLPGYDETGKRFNDVINLVNEFKNKKYLLGLATFSNSYNKLFNIGSDKENIKNAVTKLFLNNIDETNNEISKSLLNGIEEFSDAINNKYLIVLTDGSDSNISKNVEDIIRLAILKNVRICPIIYGDDDNKKYLENLSNATDCPFVLENDQQNLINLILSLTKNNSKDYIDLDNDGKKDGKILADSGFLISKNSFSFANYSSSSSINGHCYGMATIAELYYKEKLPLKINSIDKIHSYDLSNTFFNNYDSLKKYVLKTSIMKYTFGFDYFDIIPPYNFYKYNGKNYEIINPYRNEILISGMYDLKIIDKKEKPILNDEKMQITDLLNAEDKQILNAIAHAHFKQLKTPMYSSGIILPKWLKIFKNDINIPNTGGSGFINILINRLKANDAPVIGGNFNNGLHAINAIRIIQDINDLDHYYIDVYDNNYPNEKRILEISCSKKYCVTLANEYYHNSNQTISISPSLDYDLSYYR